MSNKIIGLSLPALHPGQAQIIHESKRFNAVCCGRRFGKTVLGMDRLIPSGLRRHNTRTLAGIKPDNAVYNADCRCIGGRTRAAFRP
jgi:hypothetical protein